MFSLFCSCILVKVTVVFAIWLKATYLVVKATLLDGVLLRMHAALMLAMFVRHREVWVGDVSPFD